MNIWKSTEVHTALLYSMDHAVWTKTIKDTAKLLESIALNILLCKGNYGQFASTWV